MKNETCHEADCLHCIPRRRGYFSPVLVLVYAGLRLTNGKWTDSGKALRHRSCRLESLVEPSCARAVVARPKLYPKTEIDCNGICHPLLQHTKLHRGHQTNSRNLNPGQFQNDHYIPIFWTSPRAKMAGRDRMSHCNTCIISCQTRTSES